MEYTFVTVGECRVEEELTDHSIPSLYNLPVNKVLLQTCFIITLNLGFLHSVLF